MRGSFSVPTQQVGVGTNAQQNRVSSNLRQPTSFKQKLSPTQPTLKASSVNGTGSQSAFQIANQDYGVIGGAKPPGQARPTSQSLGGLQVQHQASAPHLPVPYQHVSLFIHNIIGTTSQSSNDFAILSDSLCVYHAQSFLVFYDFVKNRQLLVYQNTNANKPYRALTYAQGRLYAGEGNTKQGEIQIFKVDITSGSVNIELEVVMRGHKYGIRQIKVQEDLVVSIGDDNDKGLLVWETVSPRIISANRMKNETQINGVAFLSNDKIKSNGYLRYVTYGSHKHLKLWSVKHEKDQYLSSYSIDEGPTKIEPAASGIPKQTGSKLIIPGIEEGYNITQVVVEHQEILYILGCSLSKTGADHKAYSVVKYNIKSQHVLLQLQQPVSSSMQLMIDISDKHILVAGSPLKRISIIDKTTMKLKTDEDFSWAQPPQKGQLQMITQDIYDYLIASSSSSDLDYSSLQGIIFEHGVFVQILADGMLQFHDLQSQRLIRVLMTHYDSINDLIIKEYQPGEEQISYFTCSKDNTLRLWSTYLGDQELLSMMQDSTKPVENDLKRIIYLEGNVDKPVMTEDEQGIKCLSYNQIRNQLAVGDMVGNIRIYQLSPDNQQQINQVNFVEAHEGKVIALQYSEPFSVSSTTNQYVHFLVSASSDRMIHIFNALSDDYDLLQTIDVHTTSIVDIELVITKVGVTNKHKITQYEKQLRLYSCSTDKILMCHKYSALERKFVPACPKDMHKNKIFKIKITDQYVVLAKDQGIVEIKSIESGKQVQQYQQQAQNLTQSRTILDYTSVALTHDNQLMALHDKEKSIQIREIRLCSSLLSRFGLADNLSSMKFTSDNQFLICSSLNSKDQGGGLIYIFKVEHSIPQIKQGLSRIQQQRNPDKVIVIDENHTTQPKTSEADRFDMMISSQPQHRKFTVREELFNTWAKSSQTNHGNGSTIKTIDSNQQSNNKLNEVIEEEDDFIRSSLGFAKQVEDSKSLEKQDSNEDLEFEDIMEDDVQSRFAQMVPLSDSSLNAFSIRNSLTKRYLVETPVPSIQEPIKDQPTFTKVVEAQKVEKTLFTKLRGKFEKVESLGSALEDIDMDDLNESEKIKLSIAIGKAMQKLGQLQLKFLSSK